MFVANPNKTRPIIEILVGNRDKLLKYLTDFHSDKGKCLCIWDYFDTTSEEDSRTRLFCYVSI